jgi:hypothetical protein
MDFKSWIDPSRIPWLEQPGKAYQRNARPNALKQEETPLSGLGSLDRQHGGAHEVANDVGEPDRVEATQLDEHERNKDQQGPSDLDQLPHIDFNGFQQPSTAFMK